MKTKQRLYPSISHGAKAFCFALLMLVTACGGQEDPIVEKEDQLQLSDKEILISADGWKPMAESRATIFDTENDLKNVNKGGGNFTLYAFTRGSETPFINGTRVRYQEVNGNGRWRFYADPYYIEYYWPQSGTYDFFACMPHGDKQKNITGITYDKTKGKVTLTCQMQSTTADGDDDTDDLDDPLGQETIIAYTPGLSKQSEAVKMHFVHPFAAIYFKLKQAHRDLTINWIRFDNVFLEGTATIYEETKEETVVEWKPLRDSKNTFTIHVQKKIPGDINFDAEFGRPYLVMPQTFSKAEGDVTITINYTWNDGTDQDKENDTKEFTRSITTNSITSWIAGNKYTYILDLGDNKEEILFKVKVEPWVSGGDKNEIDIE